MSLTQSQLVAELASKDESISKNPGQNSSNQPNRNRLQGSQEWFYITWLRQAGFDEA